MTIESRISSKRERTLWCYALFIGIIIVAIFATVGAMFVNDAASKVKVFVTQAAVSPSGGVTFDYRVESWCASGTVRHLSRSEMLGETSGACGTIEGTIWHRSEMKGGKALFEAIPTSVRLRFKEGDIFSLSKGKEIELVQWKEQRADGTTDKCGLFIKFE